MGDFQRRIDFILAEEGGLANHRRDYWQPIHGDDFPDGLDLLLLNSAINQGPITAIR